MRNCFAVQSSEFSVQSPAFRCGVERINSIVLVRSMLFVVIQKLIHRCTNESEMDL